MTFAAVAELGSFSGAARKLGLPPSTVTAHIAALEQNLGLQLIVRTTRQNRLTEHGKRFAADALRLVSVVEDAFARLEAEKANPVGQLRISVPFTFSADLLGPVIGRFATLYPGIRVEIVVSNDVIDLIAEGFDLAIRIGPLTDSSLIRRKLGFAQQVMVTSQDYATKRGVPKSPEELMDHSFVSARPEQSVDLTGPEGKIAITVLSAISANDPKTIYAIVKEGGGIAVLPRFLVAQGLRNGSLEIVLPQFKLNTVEMSLLHYGHSANNPKIELFASFLVAELAANQWL